MFTDPNKNLEQFDIAPMMKVADFGAGSGYYALTLGKLVGEDGRVYAIDIDPELLLKIYGDAKTHRLTNIDVLQGDMEKPEGSNLKSESIDRGIVSNLLFQITDKNAVLREVFRVMKKQGKVLIVDWEDSFGGLGPKKEMIFSKESARKLLKEVGFVFDREISAGNHHYGIICIKP